MAETIVMVTSDRSSNSGNGSNASISAGICWNMSNVNVNLMTEIVMVQVLILAVATNNSSSPTLHTLPARGVRRGVGIFNTLRPWTTVPTVCPQIHHHATQLPKPYPIATNFLKALELWELRKAKHDLPGISQPGLLTYVVGAVACSTTTTAD